MKKIKALIKKGFNDNAGYACQPHFFYNNGEPELVYLIEKCYTFFWVQFTRLVDICEDMHEVTEYKKKINSKHLKWIA